MALSYRSSPAELADAGEYQCLLQMLNLHRISWQVKKRGWLANCHCQDKIYASWAAAICTHKAALS